MNRFITSIPGFVFVRSFFFLRSLSALRRSPLSLSLFLFLSLYISFFFFTPCSSPMCLFDSDIVFDSENYILFPLFAVHFCVVSTSLSPPFLKRPDIDRNCITFIYSLGVHSRDNVNLPRLRLPLPTHHSHASSLTLCVEAKAEKTCTKNISKHHQICFMLAKHNGLRLSLIHI